MLRVIHSWDSNRVPARTPQIDEQFAEPGEVPRGEEEGVIRVAQVTAQWIGPVLVGRMREQLPVGETQRLGEVMVEGDVESSCGSAFRRCCPAR